MHEAGLADAVLNTMREQLRDGAADWSALRVYVRDLDGTPDQLARSIETHLAAAAPEMRTPPVEVVLLPMERICASCAARWTDAEPDPACPSCGGAPLPRPHDHWMEVELLA